MFAVVRHIAHRIGQVALAAAAAVTVSMICAVALLFALVCAAPLLKLRT